MVPETPISDFEKIELAIRRAQDRIRDLPAYNIDIIQALDFLAEEIRRTADESKKEQARIDGL